MATEPKGQLQAIDDTYEHLHRGPGGGTLNQHEPDRLDRVVGSTEDVRRAFEDMPVPMVSVHGEELTVVAANAAYRTLLGRPEPIGRTVRELFPELAGQHFIEHFERILTTGEPEQVHGWRRQVDLDGSGELVDLFLDVTAVPWEQEGRVVGIHLTLHDATDEIGRRLLGEAEAEIAREQLTQALDVITTMQDALLPTELPALPTVDIAARYLLATRGTAAGGDWFDAVVRPDGRVVLVVGDVVGHGVSASAIMGQLRAVLHDHLSAGGTVRDSLLALDRFARTMSEASATTVCAAELDPVSGDLEYCTAGHPPPLVIDDSGRTRFVDPTGAGPLATGSEFDVARTRLGPHELLMLYTDGLMERPGRSIAASTADVLSVVSDIARRPARTRFERRSEKVCEEGLELLTRGTGYADDITVLAAHRTPEIPAYHTFAAAVPSSVGALRAEVADWFADHDFNTVDEFAVLHALTELVTNAVEHAYPERSSDNSVEVEVSLRPDGTVECCVGDHGQWREDPPEGIRGRGIGMARGLVDDLRIQTDLAGTTVSFTKRLTRTARLLSGNAHGTMQGHAELAGMPFDVRAADEGLRVRGTVDMTTADELRASLQWHSRGGTMPLAVDLSGVTHLGSAGVQVLHEINQINGARLDLRAPAGSVAQQVLELVRLPYREGGETQPVKSG